MSVPPPVPGIVRADVRDMAWVGTDSALSTVHPLWHITSAIERADWRGSQLYPEFRLDGATLVSATYLGGRGGLHTVVQVHELVRSGDAGEVRPVLRQSIKPPVDSATDMGFGMALSLNRDELLIGAPFAEDGVGRAYVYRRTDGGAFALACTLEAIVEPDVANRFFGLSVVMREGALAISTEVTRRYDATDAARVYVFRRDSSTGCWRQATTIASQTGSLEFFSPTLAMHGRYLFVGAPESLYRKTMERRQQSGDRVLPPLDTGRVFVFQRGPGHTWTHVQTLRSPHENRATSITRFGRFLSVDKHVLAVGEGSGNRAHVYRHTGDPAAPWGREASLTQSRDTGFGDEYNSFFGQSVSVRGDVLVVAVPYGRMLADPAAGASRYAYQSHVMVYRRDRATATWRLRRHLWPNAAPSVIGAMRVALADAVFAFYTPEDSDGTAGRIYVGALD